MSKEVIAVIAGEELTQADYEEFLQRIPEQQRAYANHPQAKQYYVDQFIAANLFAKAGEDEKLDETEDFKNVMAKMKKETLSQMAMAQAIKGIDVSVEEARGFYEANRQMFEKGETVQAKHILVDSKEKAEEIFASIEKGEITFEDAAKAHSSCPSKEKGGDLGEFGKGQMVKEFEDAAFSAEIGKVTKPVKSQFGYHLIKVEKHNEAETKTFEEVKDQVANQLLQQKNASAFNAKLEELKAKYMK